MDPGVDDPERDNSPAQVHWVDRVAYKDSRVEENGLIASEYKVTALKLEEKLFCKAQIGINFKCILLAWLAMYYVQTGKVSDTKQ